MAPAMRTRQGQSQSDQQQVHAQRRQINRHKRLLLFPQQATLQVAQHRAQPECYVAQRKPGMHSTHLMIKVKKFNSKLGKIRG
jgi:hypothetical protein